MSVSDSAGAQTLNVINLLINSAIDGRHACYLAYVVAAKAVYLVDDAGNAGGPFAGIADLNNNTGTASNSQCTITGQGSSAISAGNVLTLTLNMTFTAGFGGNKVLYTAANDTAGGNSGWIPLGVWKVPVPPSAGPSVTGMTPQRSSSAAQVYNFTFSDTNGWQDITVTNVLLNGVLDGRVGCYIAFVPSGPAGGTVYLVDDAGDAAGPYTSMVLPGAGTVQNSQCTISAAGSSVTTSGNNLTLSLPVTLNHSFAGNRVFYLATGTAGSLNTGWQTVGTVNVP
jgi:hypothetical protein